MELITEGKAKKLFRTNNKNILLQFFKDDATAFNNKRKAYLKTRSSK